MKKLISLVLFVLVLGLVAPVNDQAAGGFKDVSTGYTFYDEVLYLSGKGVISGFADGTFKPNLTVTRAQAAMMLGRALNLKGEPRNTKFKDVPAKVTGSGYIAAAVEKGIISGYADGTYRPYDSVTRAQMAIFLNRAFTLTKGNENGFSDVSSNMAAYQSILNVSANGIASGYADGTYRPNLAVTRGQFSAFMARTLEPSFRVVNFPDKSLENSIRSRLNKPTGTIKVADMNKVTRIDGNTLDSIKDLSGIEYAKNLTYLDFGPVEPGFHEISDLSPLSGLSKLEVILLPGNKISDVSPLSGLTNLRILDLGFNQITNIEPLSTLDNLDFLGLSFNNISDIRPLNKLNNLQSLFLSVNKISDISTLSGLSELTRLYLDANEINDISALSSLTKLQELRLHENELNDINALSGLTELEILNLNNTGTRDISALGGLTKLEELNLSGNKLSDIRILSSLTKLSSLNLSVNEIKDISGLGSLSYLFYLNLSANKISDITPLSNLENLQFVTLTENELNAEAQRIIENLEARGVSVDD